MVVTRCSGSCRCSSVVTLSLSLFLLLTVILSSGLIHPTQAGRRKKAKKRKSRRTSNDISLSTSWDFVGPFPIGKGEFDGDPLASYGGIHKLPRATSATFASELATSGAVGWRKLQGQAVQQPRGAGVAVSLTLPDIQWNDLVRALSAMEVLEFQGWATADVTVPRSGWYEAECRGVNTFFLGTAGTHPLMHTGDQYSTGTIRAPRVWLTSDTRHPLRVRVRAKASTRFSCSVAAPAAPPQRGHADARLDLRPPAHTPDLVAGMLFGSHVALLATNSLPHRLQDIHLDVRGRGAASGRIVAHPRQPRMLGMSLAAGQQAALPLRLAVAGTRGGCVYGGVEPTSSSSSEAGATSQPGAARACMYAQEALDAGAHLQDVCSGGEEGGAEVQVQARVRGSSDGGAAVVSAWVSFTLRCRTLDQAFSFTFISHDGSVQHAAAVAPLALRAEGGAEPAGVPVLLTQHGTGVSAMSQAEAYKVKHAPSDKEYTFGVEGYWVVAPSRHGAHNWEGVGFLTAMSALQAVVEQSRHFAESQAVQVALDGELVGATKGCTAGDWLSSLLCVPPADPTRVLFMGHSMGGHGTIVSAVRNADRALGLAALAGWLSKEQYGDSNAFMKLDVSVSYTDPFAAAVLAATVASDSVDLVADNLRAVPVLALVGASDVTVHPWFTRRFGRVLRAAGVDVEVVEVPDKEHWWWDTDKANDGGVMNDPARRRFFERVRQRPTVASSGGTASEATSLVLTNPALFGPRRGLQVLQQRVPYRTSRIDFAASGDSGQLVATTVNVARIRVGAAALASGALLLDGVSLGGLEAGTDVCRAAGRQQWRRCDMPGDAYQAHERGPSTYGPAGQVWDQAFVIVAGSGGGDEAAASVYNNAALYLANTLNMAADTLAWVVPDTEFNATMHAEYNWVLLGGPAHNTATTWLATANASQSAAPVTVTLPVHMEEASFTVGPCSFTQPEHGLLTTFGAWDGAREQAHLGLILAGTDLAGFQSIMKLAVPTIPPMTRAPLTNLVPDVVVLGPEAAAKGWGGAKVLGAWGNKWEWRDDTSYAACN